MQILRLRLNTATADYDRIVRKAQTFLESKKQVRVQVQLRGRERRAPGAAVDLLNQVANELSKVSTIAKAPSPANTALTLNPRK